jgi:hypothetical protein
MLSLYDYVRTHHKFVHGTTFYGDIKVNPASLKKILKIYINTMPFSKLREFEWSQAIASDEVVLSSSQTDVTGY